ncbi:ParB/RepB/Spo0J family partition protein [Luteimicrobium album]|uniref:ParB/RepB/Spo0J family partition protein n=1 Tax=Luteimicrobium album TaxID=1054550 RepID=UPI003D6647A6
MSPESTNQESAADATASDGRGVDADPEALAATETGDASRSDVVSATEDAAPHAVAESAGEGDGDRAEATAEEPGTDEAQSGASHDDASQGSNPDVGTAEDAGTAEGISTTSGGVTAPVADGQDGLVPVPGASFAELPVNSIRPNPRQPRTVFDEGELDELVGSIKEIGVLQPVVVRPAPDEAGQYELIMGERRWRATQAAGLDVIPAIVRVTDDEDLLRDALLENLHRSALNPLEEAAAYRQLLDDFGCTHDELALRISRSRPQISNTLRLLRLPPLVQRRVAAGVLSAGHARALLGLSDGAAIERLAQRIVSEGLSVRATEEIVALGVGDEKAPQHRPRAGQRSEAVDELASRLSDRFETRVRVDLGKSKGKVTIEFASVEDLNRILDVMAPEDPGLLRR